MSSLLTYNSEDSGKTFVYVFFFFFSIPKSVLLGGFSLGDRQLYFLHAFTPISGSGLKQTILIEYHGSCLYAAPKLNSSLVTNKITLSLHSLQSAVCMVCVSTRLLSYRKMYRKFKNVVLGLLAHGTTSIFFSRILRGEALVYNSYFLQNNRFTAIIRC